MTKKMITFIKCSKEASLPENNISQVLLRSPQRSKLINTLQRVRGGGYSITNKYLSHPNNTLKSRRKKYSIKYNKSSLSNENTACF